MKNKLTHKISPQTYSQHRNNHRKFTITEIYHPTFYSVNSKRKANSHSPQNTSHCPHHTGIAKPKPSYSFHTDHIRRTHHDPCNKYFPTVMPRTLPPPKQPQHRNTPNTIDSIKTPRITTRMDITILPTLQIHPKQSNKKLNRRLLH